MKNKKLWLFISLVILILILNHIFKWSSYLGDTDNLTFLKATTAVLIGSVVYKACVAVALKFFEPQDMKLITAVLFLAILLIGMERKKKVKTNA